MYNSRLLQAQFFRLIKFDMFSKEVNFRKSNLKVFRFFRQPLSKRYKEKELEKQKRFPVYNEQQQQEYSEYQNYQEQRF